MSEFWLGLNIGMVIGTACALGPLVIVEIFKLRRGARK